MTRDTADALFTDPAERYSLDEVVRQTGFDPEEVTLLVECGVLVPDESRAPQWTFSALTLQVARRARRLQHEFALDDVHAVAVVVRYEQRVVALQREIAGLRARTGLRR